MKGLIATLIVLSVVTATFAQAAPETTFFDGVEMLQPKGDGTRETSVRVVFDDTSMRVIARSGGAVLKEWNYADIRAAEYSYSKNPRWKTGLGMGAAGLLIPPLLLIAIPVAFTKHRRHWVTIRTGDDFAVLKVSKSIRKVFMPAFETKTSVPIKALGDDK